MRRSRRPSSCSAAPIRPEAPEETLRRIALLTRERVAGWHSRKLKPGFASLDVRRRALHDRQGRMAGFPFLCVVGTPVAEVGSTPPAELLSLHALACDRATPWLSVLGDVKQRGVRGVRVITGQGDEGADFHRTAARLWPGATVTTQGRQLAVAR